jgi:hypothetical protein
MGAYRDLLVQFLRLQAARKGMCACQKDARGHEKTQSMESSDGFGGEITILGVFFDEVAWLVECCKKNKHRDTCQTQEKK